MGNQREIRQVLPSNHVGVAIPIRDGFKDTVKQILSKHQTGHFYTYIAVPDTEYTIPNMADGYTKLGRSHISRFIIQSGGKMWCGYEAFCDHIAEVAKYLHDAHFFVGDEEDYIDEFLIVDGELRQKRVHSGCWRPVDEYLSERFPELETL